MHDYQALHVGAHAVDDDLRDTGAVGPELAHLAQTYCFSARALVFRDPSREWRLFIVLLPLASRLSLMTNPIFTQLVRAWGLNLRFVGIDRHGLVYDFRNLLSDRMLAALIEWLRQEDQRHLGARSTQTPEQALDILFETLARDMLTVLDTRRDDWARHLDANHHLESTGPASLFDRASRYPDFLGALRQALRQQLIDTEFYGRVLRAIDTREQHFEHEAAALIQTRLDDDVIRMLHKTGVGQHLGCYNWLRIAPRQAPMRAHILTRLPAFAGFFAESLLPIESWDPAGNDNDNLFATTASTDELELNDELNPRDGGRPRNPQPPAFDLGQVASGAQSMRNVEHAFRLKQVIDSGQDRAVIQALADRFSIAENTIRLLWHDKPAALGQPPTWHLVEILRHLDGLNRRDWPSNPSSWQALMADAVPAVAN